MKDSKIRVVVFGYSLLFFHCSKISGLTSHSSSALACMLGIRALSFTCEWVARLVVTGEDVVIGAVASGRYVMANITFSLLAVCFGIDDVAVVSP